MAVDLGIVLTGTIIPNSTFVVHGDKDKRRQEYIAAIRYYNQFAPVYFLENSAYDLLSDVEFSRLENCYLRKFSPSGHYQRGKGYQEFEMITQWLSMETMIPKRFIKITGRYQVMNFKEIFTECSAAEDGALVIDRYKRIKLAITRLFYVDTMYYKENLSDVYKGCDDERGDWIERVLYKKMAERNFNSRFFRNEPMIAGIDGSTGVNIMPNRFKWFVKSALRMINYFLNKEYLLYR